MNKHEQIKNRIEKRFWHKTIPLLTSGNRAVATLINVGSHVYPIVHQASFVFKAVFWAWVGLSLGLGIGILIG